MDPALRASASGMMAQQTRTEIIANNLANVNTTGFKRSRAVFEDLLYQTVQGQSILGSPDSNVAPAIQVGRGTRLAAVQRVHDQGTIEVTNRNLDLAIEGDGMFQVQLRDGTTAYTRDGSFGISDQGEVVTADGYGLVPPIRVPSDAKQLTISASGIMTVLKGTDTEPTEVGRIELARFANPSGLLAMGQNVYQATPASGQPVTGFPDEEGMGKTVQGSLEGSNVEIVQEMVDMIAAMRAYEINSKAIKQADDMGQIANNMTR
jgi:flagellar basal-body rod protein FlgG